jgi:hypothetical protein
MMARSDRLLAFFLAALLFSVYLLTSSGLYHSSDEMAMLVTADSLARRGALDIDLLRWMGKQQGDFGPDGHLYSNKGSSTALAALPIYWLALQSDRIGNVQAGMLTNALLVALTAALIYLFLRQLRFGDGVSLVTALAFGLGTMAWPYARYLFGESLAGLSLLFSAYSLFRYHNQHSRTSPLLAGIGLGVALLTRLNTAIVMPFFGLLLLVYLARQHGRRYRAWIEPIVLFGLPVLASLMVIGGYNWIRFGSPLITGYQPEERFATPFFKGFYGLILNPCKGLLWYNPLLLAALAAWPVFVRKGRHRAEGLLIAAVVLSNVAFYSPWHLWWAGHSWGPRFLLTTLPLAILPLASALEAATRRRSLAIGLGILAAISVAVQLLGVAVDFNLYLEDIYTKLGLYHPATLFNPAYSPLLRQIAYLRPENLDLAWARDGMLDWLALLPGLLLVALAGLALWAAWRGRRSVWIGSGVFLLLAAGTMWMLRRDAPTGDVAEAARRLAAMEHPGEALVLVEPLLTEAFQNAYDGDLPLWGIPFWRLAGGEYDAVWTLGSREPEPAEARFQVGDVRLDLHLRAGQQFDAGRLPVLQLEREARLGDVVKLIAVQLDDTIARSGETLPLAVYWRALAPMDTSYTVFVQAVDERGVKAGQIDRLPCGGTCPTTSWRPGDLVGERYNLSIGAGTPPGRYQLIAGMYDLATGEHLPELDGEGNPVAPYLLLGTVQVRP